MNGIRISRRQLAMVSVSIVVSILTQWLLIPKIQWNSKVFAEGETPYPADSISSDLWNYSTIMSYGTDYGIISNVFNKYDHTETTYATNVYNFVQGSKNDDIDFISRPAHFMVGSLTPGSGLYYDKPYSDTERCPEFFIEAPSEVLATFTPMQDFDIPDENIHKISRTPEEIASSISDMIGRARDGVNEANTRSAATSDFAFPAACYISGTDPTDLTSYVRVNGNNMDVVLDSYYADKVVYINVTQEMLQAFAFTDGLSITKPDSTIVCFNFPDSLSSYSGEYDIFLNQFTVNGISPVTGPRGTDTGDPHDTIDSAICQTIVWSIPSDREVGVRCIGGMLLAPDSHVSCVNGPSCGWIVCDEIDIKCEYHFIYQNTSEATLGQYGFYLNKKLTEEFGCNPAYSAATRPVVVESTTAASRGQFSFIWQEYLDNTYSTPVGASQSFANGEGTDAIAVTFPTITFFSDEAHATDHYYVAKNSSKTFYFRVTEDQTITTEGITNSAGYVEIALTVTALNDGRFTYSVVCDSFTGEPGDVFQYNHYDGSPSGSQFYIGAFFNRIDEQISYGQLNFGKGINGINDLNTLTYDPTYYFTITRVINGTTYYYDLNGSRSTNYTEVSLTLNRYSPHTSKTINLPYGEYTITEVNKPETNSITTQSGTYYLQPGAHVVTATIDASHTYVNLPEIVNEYTTTPMGTLEVAKTATDENNTNLSGTFYFAVLNSANEYLQADESSFTTDVHYFSVNAGSTRSFVLPEGDYTVSEDTTRVDIQGYTFNPGSTTTAPVSVSASSPETANLINEYTTNTTTGSLIIHKILDTGSPAAANTTEYTFTVTGQGITRTVSVTGAGDCAEITGLTPGTYTISESSAAISGYNLAITGDTSVQISAGQQTDANITNTYTSTTPASGTLVIEKTVNGINGAAGSGPDLSLISPITFTVSGPDAAAIGTIPELSAATVSAGTWTRVTNTNIYRYVVSVPLQAGDVYTVTESSDGHNSSYSVTTTCTPSDGKVTIVGGDEVAASFVNEYTPVTYTGSLVIRKTITGATLSQVGTIRFTAVGTGSTSGSLTIPDLVNGNVGTVVGTNWIDEGSGVYTFTVSGLDQGATYRVEETADGHNTSYDVSVTPSGKVVNVTIPTSTTAYTSVYAEFTDAYSPVATPTGTLEVTKTVTGATAPAGTTYYVVLTSGGTYYNLDGKTASSAADAVQQITVSGNRGTITYTGLDTSKTYTVTETNSSGVAINGSSSVPAAITGYDWTTAGSNIVANSSAFDTTTHQATAAITNNYTAQSTTVELIVQKVVTGCPSAASHTFGFYLHDENNQYYDVNGDPVPAATAITFTTSTRAEISGLPAGHTYTVEETGANQPYSPVITGYDLAVTYTGNGVRPDAGDTATITVNNTYTQQTGALEVSKVLNAPAGSSITGPFYFYIQDGDGKFLQNDGTFTANTNYFTVDVSTPFTMSGVPVGTYTITEITAPNAANTAYRSGYSLLATYTGAAVSNVNTLTISKNLTSEAVINNTYTVDGVELTVQKVVTGCPSAASHTFGFYLHDENNQYYDANGDPVPAATAITFTTSTPARISLPARHTYTVEETGANQPYSPDITGYDLSVSYTGNGVSMPNDGDTATITVNNIYTQQVAPTTGTLVVTKTVTGDTSITGPFTFTVTNAAGEYLQAQDTGVFGSAVVTFSVAAGGTATFTNIPDGTVCTVTETNADTYGNLESGSATSGSATIVAGGSVSVDLINAYATPTPTTDPSTPTTAPSEPTTAPTTPTTEPSESTESTQTSETETSETDSDSSPAVPLTGCLIINKTISGASLGDLDAISFVLTDTACGATRDVPALTLANVQCGLWGDAGNGTYYCIIDGLSAGITYNVTESADGHTAVYTLDAGSVTSASVAIVANETVSVSLSDTYVQTGSSTVPTEPGVESSETTAPGEGGETTEGTTAPVPEVTTVTLANGTTLNPDCYTVNSDGSITLTAAGRNVLGAGRHQVTITYADGTTRTQTVVVDSADRVPATGENGINTFAALILITSAALVFTAKKLREEEI